MTRADRAEEAAGSCDRRRSLSSDSDDVGTGPREHALSVQTAQLLVYRFGSDAAFEGRLVGALERIEAGAAVKIVDALFVASDPESGELVAIDLGSNGAGGIVAPLLRFRLEPGLRRRATERALT